jgi:hypothetical protein
MIAAAMVLNKMSARSRNYTQRLLHNDQFSCAIVVRSAIRGIDRQRVFISIRREREDWLHPAQSPAHNCKAAHPPRVARGQQQVRFAHSAGREISASPASECGSLSAVAY